MIVSRTIVVCLLVMVPLTSFAGNYAITTSDLNVRTGPGTRFTISFTLSKGTQVEVISTEDKWVEISYSGKTGYAYTKYLKAITARVSSSKATASSGNRTLIAFVLCVILVTTFFVYRKVRDNNLIEMVTHTGRGERSERDLVLTLLKSGIPEYNIYHDLYVGKREGEFSQADVVVLTESGIIVFEVKDYSGWIFGSGNQREWTQVLSYGKQKFRFYNPVMQNRTHVNQLQRKLEQFKYLRYYSVIVFYGNCELKNLKFIPEGTFIVKPWRVLDVIGKIRSDNHPIKYTDITEINRILKEAVTNGGIVANQVQHQQNIKNMLGTHRVFD